MTLATCHRRLRIRIRSTYIIAVVALSAAIGIGAGALVNPSTFSGGNVGTLCFNDWRGAAASATSNACVDGAIRSQLAAGGRARSVKGTEDIALLALSVSCVTVGGIASGGGFDVITCRTCRESDAFIEVYQ
jgi:hypothetical protein